MRFERRAILIFACLTVWAWGTGAAHAEPSRAETKAWNAAVAKFQDAASPLLWSSVEAGFADFTAKYPASEHYPEAVVYHARALFEQGRFDGAIGLLAKESTNAAAQADNFLYWTGLSLGRKGDDNQAADTFARLAREYPDSALRPKAIFLEAEAHSRLGLWKRVIEDLAEADGPFQRFARSNPEDEMVRRGLLLLARARLTLKDYDGVDAALSGKGADQWRGDFAWQRQWILCRAQLERGAATNALAGAASLVALSQGNPLLKARSTLLQGEILETLGRWNEAAQTYQANMDAALPAETRQEALFRATELRLRQGGVGEARKLLEGFPQTNDVILLLRGELALKQWLLGKDAGATHDPAAGATNLLQAATEDFQQLIAGFTNSTYLGKAELNLGWCQLEGGKTNEAQAAFLKAVAALPPSEDRAVAYFKLGDLLCRQGDYRDALDNYNAVLLATNAISRPQARKELAGQALYQTVRAAVAAGDAAAADKAMRQLLDEYPDGQLAERGLLFLGQANAPAKSRALFAELTNRFPQSALVPQVRLALGRSYEMEGDWGAALDTYKAWLRDYPSNDLRFQAEFAAAMMTAKSGDESNAYSLFTNYAAVYKTNAQARARDLPALAQYEVGNHFWNQEEYQKAELAYQELNNNWPESPLAFQAIMQAGRAAIQRQSPQEARSYFTNLTGNDKTPPSILVQALFGAGDATMALTANPKNYEDAIEYFNYIVANHPESPSVPEAWGRMGDCYQAMAGLAPASASNAVDSAMISYGRASEAYLKAMQSPNTRVRSQAEVQLGDVEAKMAGLTAAEERKRELLRSAFDHFLNVFDGSNLEGVRQPDLEWVGKAGQRAAELAKNLGDTAQAARLYQRMIQTFPSLKPELEKKILELQQPAGGVK